MRNVIVHYHIFKNAGTTFDGLLKRNFGRAFVDHREDDKMVAGGAQYLEEFIKGNVKLKAISSHHMVSPLPDIENINLHPVFFLRHPIERALSVYLFEKKQISQSKGAQMAKKLDFKAYVKWRMLQNTPGVIRNYQLRTMLGLTGKLNRQVFDDDLELALGKIESGLFHVGVVEKFESSVNSIFTVLDPYFSGLNRKFKPLNVNSKNIKKPLSEKLVEIEGLLGEEIELLYQENDLDLRLWESIIAKCESHSG
ncbi:sulfotransferase family 2 domain-containing protein [Simiduia aestuariiviva]|uniref:Sulfotransferase family protein n=1 Tax=Simiduia aestuariiviva TaxID=1510459 RepID=A0A839USL2_9GAMM|nr:sulfotransferase family 2 domain-containing protein [Simiduia aestuariiviva]MBB3168365.1 hypothetical protein [Simiduia aestuariiviva]